MTALTPTAAQSSVIREVQAWLRAPLRKDDLVRYLAGVAGSGKTSIARLAVDGFSARFCAPSGKAALVLRERGAAEACTVHSLLYRPTETYQDGRRVVRYSRNESGFLTQGDVDVVVADECSMVSSDLFRDLLAFGVRVLVLGDPFQLPPVSGEGAFASRRPDWLLEEVHRQAAESGVLRLATDVREGRGVDPRPGAYGADVVVAPAADVDLIQTACEYDQILVGTHRSRAAINSSVRAAAFGALGVPPSPLPVAGDRLVCRRNDRERGLVNGGLWTVVSSRVGPGRRPSYVELVLDALGGDPDGPGTVQVSAHPHLFLGEGEALKRMGWAAAKAHAEYDYAYALTVHSAQGSAWDSVAVLDESSCFREDAARHLYTAVTRAARRLLVLR